MACKAFAPTPEYFRGDQKARSMVAAEEIDSAVVRFLELQQPYGLLLFVESRQEFVQQPPLGRQEVHTKSLGV
jgi:hypothetical protein